MEAHLNLYMDCETTAKQPQNGELISLAMIAEQEGNHLGEFYEECRIDGPRIQTDIWGKERNLWPDPTNSKNPAERNATDVHGITWERAQHFQSPVELYRKLWKYLNGLQGTKYNFIFHSNTLFDPKWLFYRSNLHAPPLYKLLVSRSYYYEPLPETGECLHRLRYADTMSMAQKYIKNGSDTLKKAEKLQKAIDKNMGYLTKVRKYPAKQEQLDKWKDAIAKAENEMSLLGNSNVTLKGYALNKICDSLGLELDHHNALSDTKVLWPIYTFLKENL